MASTLTKGKKAKNAADTPNNEVVTIAWVQNQYTKHAGNEQIQEYIDPQTKQEMELIHPKTGLVTPYTILGGKTMKLNITTNEWHKAVYEFILGHTHDEDTEPPGMWRGYPSFNPKKKKYILENASEKAKRNNLNRKQTRVLHTRVEDMSNEFLGQVGLLFGFDPKKDSYDDILDGMARIIDTPASDSESFFTSANVQDTLDNPDFKYVVLIAVLKNNGTLKLDNGVYRFNGATVGIEDGQLIQWLKDNSTVYQTLKGKYLAESELENQKEEKKETVEA